MRHFARGVPLDDAQAWTLAAFKMGWLGVDLFFVLSGFCREVFKELPMEFALEAQQLLGITLEGSVG